MYLCQKWKESSVCMLSSMRARMHELYVHVLGLIIIIIMRERSPGDSDIPADLACKLRKGQAITLFACQSECAAHFETPASPYGWVGLTCQFY